MFVKHYLSQRYHRLTSDSSTFMVSSWYNIQVMRIAVSVTVEGDRMDKHH